MLNGITWQNAVGLAIVVVMSGLIAYWGDLLGRRMGKRRLSLAGLRPRYTAIAVTTITGMLIAILTIGIMAGVSQRVRLLMLRGLEIVSERKQIERQLKTTEKSIDRASREIAREKAAWEVAKKEAGQAEKRRDIIVAERDHLTRALACLKADLRRNQASLILASRHLAEARGGLMSARKEVEARRLEIREQKASIAELEDMRARLIAAGKAAISSLAEMQERNITLRLGDELSRSVIPCSGPKAEIKNALLAVIDQADKRAIEEGCVPKGKGRAVEILPIEFQGKLIPESDVVDAITENISAGNGSVVARVISLSNTVEGEPALVNIVLHPNRLIYKSGDEVASTIIDGSRSRGYIFGNLVQFFKTRVRSSAIRKGVIPSTDDEGQLSVGQIPGDMLMDLVDRIGDEGRPVSVRAVVVKDTWSADTLVLHLIVGDRE